MLKKRFSKHQIAIGFFITYWIGSLLLLIFCNGTGDAGDSIAHYQFARYAPQHPELFFHHWAKPVFVLFACPFTQFGFIGVKCFNIIVTGITIWTTYRIALQLQLKNSWATLPLMMGAPLLISLVFSGLTEPLFALFLALPILACLEKKYAFAAIVLSIMPYVRSEGLIIIGVFVFYFILEKQWKAIILLMTGSVLYGIAGYFVHGTVFWVFTEIPYAELSSPYGKGELFHFVNQLLYVVGIPIYILFALGLIVFSYQTIIRKTHFSTYLIIAGSFGAFFVAHSLFWYWGIFNSMGLKRVLIGVMPAVAIIALYGFNSLTTTVPWKKAQVALSVLLISLIVVFPLLKNKASLHVEKDLMLSPMQVLIEKACNNFKETKKPHSKLYSIHPHAALALNMDCFDRTKYQQINLIDHMKKDDLLIWDNWFAPVEMGVPLERIKNDTNLIQLSEDIIYDSIYQRDLHVVLMKRK